MNYSELSRQRLYPGKYKITAIFDGNDEFLPTETEYEITITQPSAAAREIEPIDYQWDDPIIKTDPDISFTPNTDVIEDDGINCINIQDYLNINTEYPIDYTISYSQGLTRDEDNPDIFYLNSIGPHLITLTTTENDIYNEKTITLEVSIEQLLDPEIEYNPNNFTVINGYLIKDYFNYEKREGFYEFDLEIPDNPHNLPLIYKIYTEDGSYVNSSNNKVYIMNSGIYQVEAMFISDGVYNSAKTSYWVRYDSDKVPGSDTPVEPVDPTDKRKDAGIYYDNPIQSVKYSETGRYNLQPVMNPNSVEPIVIKDQNGNIIELGIFITDLEEGEWNIYAVYAGNSEYKPKTVSFKFKIFKEQGGDTPTPGNKENPNIRFIITQRTDYITEEGIYIIPEVDNPNGVEYTITSNKGEIIDGYLHYDGSEDVQITLTSKEDDTYYSSTSYFILYLLRSAKKDPNISFEYKDLYIRYTSEGKYLIQPLINPNEVEYEITSSIGRVEKEGDDYYLYTDLLDATPYIQATTLETEVYFSTTVRYTLHIYNGAKRYLNAKSFDYTERGRLNIEKEFLIIEWNNSENLEFNENEWTITSSMYSRAEAIDLISETRDGKTFIKAKVLFKQEGKVLFTVRFLGNDEFYESKFDIHTDYSEVNLLDPRIYFEKSIIYFDMNEDGEYPIQKVMNPNKVNISYQVSKGTIIKSDIISYDTYGTITVKAISEETDIYYSKTITYELRIKQNVKPEPELYFQNPVVELYTNDYITYQGHYELQYPVNPNGITLDWAISDGTVWPSYGEFEYHYTGELTISATSRETSKFRSKTVYYKVVIKESSQNPRVMPGIYFDKARDVHYINELGKYPVLPVMMPEGVEVEYEVYSDLGTVVKEGDNYYLSFKGTYENSNYNVKIYAKSRQTDIYYSQTIDYVLQIAQRPEKHSPFISYNKNYEYFPNVAQDGRYKLQELNNPYNVKVYYSVDSDEAKISDDEQYLEFSGTTGSFTITAISHESDEYTAGIATYNLAINITVISSLETVSLCPKTVEGELNEDIITNVIKIKKEPSFIWDPAEWTISSSYYNVLNSWSIYDTTEDEDYIYVRLKLNYKKEDLALITLRFLGNTRYYGERFDLKITFRLEQVIPQDPVITWPLNPLRVDQHFPEKYLLQMPNITPNDIEILEYTSNHGEVSYENGNYYLTLYHYAGDVYLTIRTKSTRYYNSVSSSWRMIINSNMPELYFLWSSDSENFSETNLRFYIPPLVNTFTLPVSWSTPNLGRYDIVGDDRYLVFDYDELSTTEDNVITIRVDSTDPVYTGFYAEYTLTLYFVPERIWPDFYFENDGTVSVPVNMSGKYYLQTPIDGSGTGWSWLYARDEPYSGPDVQEYTINHDNEGYYIYLPGLTESKFIQIRAISHEGRVGDYYYWPLEAHYYLSINFQKQTLSYTKHADYNYGNISPKQVFYNVELLEYTGDHVLDGGTSFTVNYNGKTYDDIEITDLRVFNNKLLCTISTLKSEGEEDICITYYGNDYYDPFVNEKVKFKYSVDSQYVVKNALSFAQANISEEENLQSNQYDIQTLTNNSPFVFYYKEEYCDRITDKFTANALGDYVITAFINGGYSVSENKFYEYAEAQYTHTITPYSSYVDYGNFYFNPTYRIDDQKTDTYLYDIPRLIVSGTGRNIIRYADKDGVVINGDQFYYDDIGLITLYAEDTNSYPRERTEAKILIRENLLADPGFYVDSNYQYITRLNNYNEYQLQEIHDPNSVGGYTVSTSNGRVEKRGNNYYLIYTYDGSVRDITISISRPADATYRAKTVSYHVVFNISDVIIEYNESDHFETLRYNKSDYNTIDSSTDSLYGNGAITIAGVSFDKTIREVLQEVSFTYQVNSQYLDAYIDYKPKLDSGSFQLDQYKLWFKLLYKLKPQYANVYIGYTNFPVSCTVEFTYKNNNYRLNYTCYISVDPDLFIQQDDVSATYSIYNYSAEKQQYNVRKFPTIRSKNFYYNDVLTDYTTRYNTQVKFYSDYNCQNELNNINLTYDDSKGYLIINSLDIQGWSASYGNIYIKYTSEPVNGYPISSMQYCLHITQKLEDLSTIHMSSITKSGGPYNTEYKPGGITIYHYKLRRAEMEFSKYINGIGTVNFRLYNDNSIIDNDYADITVLLQNGVPQNWTIEGGFYKRTLYTYYTDNRIFDRYYSGRNFSGLTISLQ